LDYPTPLIEAQFQNRYKRFFADVKIKGQAAPVVAHVPNTGGLTGICDHVRPCRLLKHNDPKRKLQYTLEQVKVNDTWVGVNTHRANMFVWEAFTERRLPHWHSYNDGAREVKISPESRLDLRLNGPKMKPHFVEIKSVTLAENGVALFPDAETTRGQKHLRDLMKLQHDGASCEIFFVVQRDDCKAFAPAEKIDREYARLLSLARDSGVRISVYQVDLGPEHSELTTLPLTLQF